MLPIEDTLGVAADAQQGESVRRIEALFVAARTAIGALRTSEADSALEEAEALIRAHSELPQAAWLLAEHHAISAERLQEDDPARAHQLWLAAAVLEGQRGEAFRDSARPPVEIELPAEHELTLRGVYARDQVGWDSLPVRAKVSSRPGEHHVRVLRSQRLFWSGWVSVGEEATSVDLSLPAPTPCSADDLSGTLDQPHGPKPLPGTRCADWAVARKRGEHLELARCHAAECGGWQLLLATTRAPPATQAKPSSGVPRWLTYAAVGAGTALVAGLVLAQSGALGGSDSTRERWVYTGFK